MKQQAPVAGEAPPQLLTVKQTLAILQMSRSKFDTLVRNGELPIIKSDRAVRISMDAIRKWIAEKEQVS